MKKITILGSTGQIGKQTLDIIRAYPKEFKVIGLSTNKNETLLKKQVKEFAPKEFGIGEIDLMKIATLPGVDLVVVAVVGLAGLLPTLAAIKAGKNIALATKEVLVVAGELVMREARKNRANIIPIDSEHSAIFQCLGAEKKEELKKIILTMGKGKFALMRQQELQKITLKNIYQQPNWKMGLKTTVDSATCLNKSFEVVEAKWLFDLPKEKIEVIVHPEYLCHSLVEFQDGSIFGEFGTADMKRYIQYALFYPERKPAKITRSINLINKKISFEPAPYKKFPGLTLGFKALEFGGTMPAVMHGADDIAVREFINNKIKFTDIPKIIEKTMFNHQVIKNPNLEEILQAEKWARSFANKFIND